MTARPTAESRVVTRRRYIPSMGVDRRAEARGLRAVEQAGLITVSHGMGRRAMVTLVDHLPISTRSVI